MFFVKIIIVELEEYMIEINMWMDLFKKVILERGYEYFESGKIKDIHWDGNTVYGKVNVLKNIMFLLKLMVKMLEN